MPDQKKRKPLEVNKLVKQSLDAVRDEIKAVQKNPKREILFHPEQLTGEEDFTYSFDSPGPSFQYVDELVLVSESPAVEGTVVRCDEKKLIIRFDKQPSDPFISAEVEWISDFVLRRTEDQLLNLSPKGLNRISEIFTGKSLDEDSDEEGSDTDTGENREDDDDADTPEALHDGLRNESQQEAIIKAMMNRVTYVWGPPGTGKTATLGYIIANYLLQGKRVLFASNTNRAVDVGLLSTVHALRDIAVDTDLEELTRLGETALSHPILDSLEFENQLNKRREQITGVTAIPDDRNDVRKKFLEETIAKLRAKGKKIPPKLEFELEVLSLKTNSAEDDTAQDESVAAELENLLFREIRRKRLVATTLARVCTSDLLMSSTFDAVVIDEASMANIPYLLVLAAKSRSHFVIAGDPMQLPPISTTSTVKHRDFLEQDIYTLVSGASKMEDLFVWKDLNPGITCFFDTQYRLKDDLARVISEVFYAGRLKTGKAKAIPVSHQSAGGAAAQTEADFDDKTEQSNISVYVVDSSKYNPSLQTGGSESGFRPDNQIHRQLTLELVRRLILRERVHPGEIGIIVPFRSVVWDYRKDLRSAGFNEVEVGTIHTYQGREKTAILFDLVMTGQGVREPKRHFSVRPFDESKNGLGVPRLLNVAFSRAREKMVVIADMHHINRIYRDKFLGGLLKQLMALHPVSS
ncbi:MAG: DNA2/NAM7 family helicase [Balneolales bacterium]|nr:DNA2/NAM7 family helicase [Balneolales bacterium]